MEKQIAIIFSIIVIALAEVISALIFHKGWRKDSTKIVGVTTLVFIGLLSILLVNPEMKTTVAIMFPLLGVIGGYLAAIAEIKPRKKKKIVSPGMRSLSQEQ